VPVDDIAGLLNELIKTSQDGRKGFAEAAEYAQDADLKSLFILRSSECAQAVSELELAVENLGRLPAEHGSIAGAVHRGWIKAKVAVEDNNIAVLEELERGQDHAKAVYGRVMQSRLPPEIRTLVERQQIHLQRSHDEIRALRDRYRAAA
jgi:uncharacterized protein (TIGR02284 family)